MTATFDQLDRKGFEVRHGVRVARHGQTAAAEADSGPTPSSAIPIASPAPFRSPVTTGRPKADNRG